MANKKIEDALKPLIEAGIDVSKIRTKLEAADRDHNYPNVRCNKGQQYACPGDPEKHGTEYYCEALGPNGEVIDTWFDRFGCD